MGRKNDLKCGNSQSLAVGLTTGYSLYSLGNIDTSLERIYTNDGEPIKLIERLFESSLVAVVTATSPRKLKVCHFKRQSEICNYSYSNTILAIKLNRDRLVVCLEESLYIHNIQDMKVVHTIRDTPTNPSGLCALSSSSDHCYLAYPGSVASGEVQIFDAINLQAKTMIEAHNSSLYAIAFNSSGTQIATASEKGTVIRVFSTIDGKKLYEFRRGMKRCVKIASLSFSTCSDYLVCSSNTETVHIFKLDKASMEPETSKSPDDWSGYFSLISQTARSYLPTQVTDVFTQGRAFASVVLPEANVKRICAITTIQKSLRLLIASMDGHLYVYSIAPVEGGECQLVKKHNLRTAESLPISVRDPHSGGPKTPSPPSSGQNDGPVLKGDDSP
ncbi:WD repeat domain phosphoinositide-interacting protein 2 isoform X4 [Hermetia illucens]|uniref:WD repeat domain phosphoinositide-interacting protein 2 isoform X4 n=1 Tax=Hermetia illucens TaxID=343691 RepID=UPI0018CC09CF|nr:WD repeat domain phosphoinositide-interacting protein 2 isoform X4 [Hermetia illucens]